MSDDNAPKLLANKVIKQFVQHLLGEDMVIDPADFMAIRTVFRWAGGSWESLANGDVLMLELLQKIISAWGKMDERVSESDREV
jgi:hypothetical protein